VNLVVFAIVLCSAFTHAIWNFFAKKAAGNLVVTWSGLWMASLALLPVSAWLLATGELPAPEAWIFMAGSGISHALYFTTLMRSYGTTDISTAYPISRGIGVGGTALLAVGVLEETVSAPGAAGIMLILAGVLLIGIRIGGLRAGLRRLGWPVLVGLCTVSYSVMDKVGVAGAHPVIYINASTLVACVALSPFLLARYRGRLSALWVADWKTGALIGIGATGTYLLILFAFREAQASYIVAVREFSVVVGALLGVVFLRERVTAGKLAGVAAIVAGLVLVRLA
jgi:uncharacterized membrane protein